MAEVILDLVYHPIPGVEGHRCWGRALVVVVSFVVVDIAQHQTCLPVDTREGI